MLQKTFLRVLCVSLFAVLATPLPAHAQGGPPMGTVPVFELHSGFWVNLHHFLYRQAREQRDPAASKSPHEPPQGLTEQERQVWEEAVNYYAANYADRDLLFNSELIALKNQLGDFEDCKELAGTSRKECNAGLPGKLTPILDAAAPIYRAHWWTEHDRANRRWVAAVAPLIRQKGLGLAERLAEIYQSRWPKEKIRVEVTAYANWAGAYTTLDPLRVTISSKDSGNQGEPALEIIFHEASHGLAGSVQAAIVRECRQRNKAIPRDLWHALLFYTTGETIKAAMKDVDPPGVKPGQPYVPYAVREGLYARGWAGYLQLLERYWQPYLEGRATFDDAIARMVSAM
jgi:hypothetical protein